MRDQGADPAGDLKAGVATASPRWCSPRRSTPAADVPADQAAGERELVRQPRRGGAQRRARLRGRLLTDAHSVPAGLTRIPLGSEQVVVVAASKSPTRRDGNPWRLRDLAGEGWLLNPSGCACRAALVKASTGCNCRSASRPRSSARTSNSRCSPIARLGLIPRRQFEQSPHRRKLRILDVLDFTFPVTVTLVRNARRGASIRHRPVGRRVEAKLRSGK